MHQGFLCTHGSSGLEPDPPKWSPNSYPHPSLGWLTPFLFLFLLLFSYILTFYFKIIIDSQEIRTIVERSGVSFTVFPNSHILHDYCTQYQNQEIDIV